MDGFHLDNAVLRERGLLERKGAPETFDVDGLRTTLRRLRWPREPVAVPLFDRDLDLARAGGRVVAPTQSIVLVEGNYLLLDTPPWSGLSGLFDCTIAIQADIDELRQRLIARWLEQGLTPELAAARADTNDMANARLVDAGSQRADIVCQI
jgi:pantothenate kinase